MKSMLMAGLLPLLLFVLSTAATTHQHGAATLDVKPKEEPADKKEPAEKKEDDKEAPAEEKVDDKEAPALETLRIKFEIENFNYYDLTKETCPEKVVKKHHHKHHSESRQRKTKAVEAGKDDKEDKKDKADKTPAADSPLPAVDGKPPWMDKKDKKDAPPPPPAPPTVLGDTPSKLPWMEKKGKKEAPPPPPPAPPQKVDMAPAIDTVHANSEHISSEIKKGLGTFGSKDDSVKPPWSKKQDGGGAAASFLQVGTCVLHHNMGETKSTECTTIMDVLRTTIKDTVKGIIACLYQESLNPAMASPGPAPWSPVPVVSGLLPAPGAPAAAGTSFLHVKPSEEKKEAALPAPAPAPAPGPSVPPMPDVRIFVTFSPGRKIGSGRSTIVEIAFLDTPSNGIDDVAGVKPFLVECMHNGFFNKQLENSLEDVTSIPPKVFKPRMDTQKVEQWNIKKCEKHIRAIVDEFTHHYTRQQVPMALYNECTNFMTRMSFSHDYVLDPLDTKRCRRATRKFEKHWNYGKHTKDEDFEEMCHNACEAKYGRNAPKCNVKHGDDLLGQPLL